MSQPIRGSNTLQDVETRDTPFPISRAQAEQTRLCLVTDACEHYQGILQPYFSANDLIWVRPEAIETKAGEEIRELLMPASALLIDWSLHAASLLGILRSLRVGSEIPILAMCGDHEAEHVAALITGADETLTRMFNPMMLSAKLVAYQRSIQGKSLTTISTNNSDCALYSRLHDKRPFNYGPFEDTLRFSLKRAKLSKAEFPEAGETQLNMAARTLLVEGKEVALTPLEFNVLAELVQNAGICLSREQLINKIWGITYETGTNFLDVHIHAIRKKIKDAGSSINIATIRGIGYRFEHR